MMPDRKWKNLILYRRLLRFGVVCCLFALMGCQPSLPKGERVKVVRVVSGQTLEVLAIDGQSPETKRVRLLGIDAPTGKQEPWSTQAKARLESLIGESRIVMLEADVEPLRELEEGSRQTLAYVWQDQQFVNEALVAEGYALARSVFPNTKYEHRLANAQEKARLSGVGIWHPSQPMGQTPEEFRRMGAGDERVSQ
jgi:micrococcal nuclease